MGWPQGKPHPSKGKPMPHSKEWEEKRLAAVRVAAVKRRGKRLNRKPPTQPMLDALAKKRADDPERFKRLSIANLPKDISGSKNGNWRGGKTLRLRGVRLSNAYRLWRRAVLQRDGNRCKDCGSDSLLHVHHIVSVSECEEAALVPMNGVTLCQECHKKTDSFAGRGKRAVDVGSFLFLLRVIPHKWQAYETIGNWAWAGDILIVFVSDLGDWRMNMLVGTHEMTEAALCRQRNISDDAVTAFDLEFETKRVPGNTDEPGDDSAAPYRREHRFATQVERMIAHELGVDWELYEQRIEEL